AWGALARCAIHSLRALRGRPSLFACRGRDPVRALRRGNSLRAGACSALGERNAPNVRLARFDASPPSPHAGAAGRERWALTSRRTASLTVGSGPNPRGIVVARSVGGRRYVLALSRGGRDRRGALPGRELCRHALGPHRRMLRAPREDRTIG